MAHLAVSQREPLSISFKPSRRHSRHTGPMYLPMDTPLDSRVRLDSIPNTTPDDPFGSPRPLHPATFRRPATIVRQRSYILNGMNPQPRSLQSRDRGVAPAAR